MTVAEQQQQEVRRNPNEIIKFYRDKNMILSVEDVMTDKLDPKRYKILFKLVPLDKQNKSRKEEVLSHFIDVSEAKRLYHHILNKNNIEGLYNNKETISNSQIPCYKDLKGGMSNNQVVSRIFTFYEYQNTFVIQLTLHKGRKNPQGAVIPASGPLKRYYIKLTSQEIELLALELKDFINIKETIQFKEYHLRTVNKNSRVVEHSGDFSW